jgi:hypothetical protein
VTCTSAAARAPPQAPRKRLGRWLCVSSRSSSRRLRICLRRRLRRRHLCRLDLGWIRKSALQTADSAAGHARSRLARASSQPAAAQTTAWRAARRACLVWSWTPAACKTAELSSSPPRGRAASRAASPCCAAAWPSSLALSSAHFSPPMSRPARCWPHDAPPALRAGPRRAGWQPSSAPLLGPACSASCAASAAKCFWPCCDKRRLQTRQSCAAAQAQKGWRKPAKPFSFCPAHRGPSVRCSSP